MNKFDQYIQYRALAFKYGSGLVQTPESLQGLIDAGAMLQADGTPITEVEQVWPEELKNLCAKVPVSLVEEIDSTIELLKMSKREFVEMAVREALDRANSICKDIDIFEFYANSSEENV